MAQPLFDEHPLQEYFQEAGEDSEPMPGGDSQFLAEVGLGRSTQPSALAQSILHAFGYLEDMYSSLLATKSPRPSNSFEERFKYDVISSSLLSTSLAASPHPGRRHFNLENLAASDHSRTSSTLTDQDIPPPHVQTLTWPAEPGDIKQTVAIVSAAVVAFAAGYEFLGMLLLAAALYVNCAAKPAPETSDFATLTLDAVNELISSGNVWDSAVHEAMSVIEKEERSSNTYYGSTSPHSPLSSLRVALQSSLHTTQSQCDNVRQLLAALTSPSQLAQLSEMYAPASPKKPTFSLDNGRPTSDPVSAWRKRTISMPSGPSSNKRATWSGAPRNLAAVANMNALRKKEHRRSDMHSLFLQPQGSSSMSEPPSPLAQRVLQGVDEEGQTDFDSELAYTKEEDVFGVAALDLRRRRRQSGMDAFGVPPPSYSSTSSHTLGHSPQASVSSISSPSRFTLLQTNRHPLSVSALHLALQGALGAKRYACAHLLALRFEEDADDDAYWEDVRSVMALLTSTFADASSTLLAALDEAEKRRMKDERPSTESLAGSSRDGSMSPDVDSKRRLSGFFKSARKMAEMSSFAPMPSHLARFAAHVDAISSALNDAREHLEQCVASVREEKNLDTSMMANADGPAMEPLLDLGDENPALQAYERLRRELGYALRECERGREKLLEVLAVPKEPANPASEDEDEFLDVSPALAQDFGSDDSNPDSALLDHRATFELPVPEVESRSQPFDDATEHLLITASAQHLPPPGIEQVFAADTSSIAPYTRERSKLSREERIKLAKARRESGRSEPVDPPRRESWGPGGEVVQELKDVIWKVGEKRRKLSEKAPPPPLSPPPSTPPPALTIEVTDDDDAILAYDSLES